MVLNLDWQDEAACRGQDPELFFPTGNNGPALAQIADAKQVCGGCPVREQCLRWALGALPYGIGGGLTEGERRQQRQQRQPDTG